MKVNELLIETPLADYQHLSAESRTPKELKANNTVEKLKKWFNRIGYDIYAYTMYSYKTPTSPSAILEIGESDIDYYVKVSKSALEQYIGKQKADRIKTHPKGITIIFVHGSRKSTEFPFTPWGLVHDFIHGIDMGGKQSQEINNLMSVSAQLSFNYGNPNKERLGRYATPYRHRGKFYSDIGTMKSARDRAFDGRPDEFETELLTQYIVTGDIKFNIPDYIEDKQAFKKDLNTFKKRAIKEFNSLLKKAAGNIYMTQL